jgi:hypothetical protein
MIIEPGDDVRAAERVVALLEDFAVRFDPVDRITFSSAIIRRLAPVRAKLQPQIRAIMFLVIDQTFSCRISLERLVSRNLPKFNSGESE